MKRTLISTLVAAVMLFVGLNADAGCGRGGRCGRRPARTTRQVRRGGCTTGNCPRSARKTTKRQVRPNGCTTGNCPRRR